MASRLRRLAFYAFDSGFNPVAMMYQTVPTAIATGKPYIPAARARRRFRPCMLNRNKCVSSFSSSFPTRQTDATLGTSEYTPSFDSVFRNQFRKPEKAGPNKLVFANLRRLSYFREADFGPPIAPTPCTPARRPVDSLGLRRRLRPLRIAG